VALLCASALVHALPAADRVHNLMEAAHPKPRAPRLNIPYAPSGLITARSALIALPAALGGMAVLWPDTLARLLIQVLCYIGSLLEPFDSLLPETGVFRSLVNTVKQAKRAYNVKHGIPSASPTPTKAYESIASSHPLA
jgi:hypothetical protein